MPKVKVARQKARITTAVAVRKRDKNGDGETEEGQTSQGQDSSQDLRRDQGRHRGQGEHPGKGLQGVVVVTMVLGTVPSLLFRLTGGLVSSTTNREERLTGEKEIAGRLTDPMAAMGVLMARKGEEGEEWKVGVER